MNGCFETVLIGNLLSILLLITILLDNRMHRIIKKKEGIYIAVMIYTALTACFFEPITNLLDGRGGRIVYFIIYMGKTWLFVGLSVVALMWIMLLHERLGIWRSRWWKPTFLTLPIAGIGMMFINLLFPIVFWIDEGNHYHQKMTYVLYFLYLLIYTVLGVVMYTQAKNRRLMIRFVPIWEFVFPLLIGILSLFMFNESAITWPCIAVAITGMLFGIKNDMIFTDHLTGLYNRAYIDLLQREIRKHPRITITGIMLDLDNFKGINDRYGHLYGDEALVETAEILKRAVDECAVLIRYAGDEFIVLIETPEMSDSRIAAAYKKRIRRSFEQFNAEKKKPYRLSASMGSLVYDPDTMTMDDLIDQIDREVYENKRGVC